MNETGPEQSTNLLRIFLSREEANWVAQGLEVNAIAYSPTREEALTRLFATIEKTAKEYLRTQGSYRRMLIPAPNFDWDNYWQAVLKGKKPEWAAFPESIRGLKLPFDGLSIVEELSPTANPLVGDHGGGRHARSTLVSPDHRGHLLGPSLR